MSFWTPRGGPFLSRVRYRLRQPSELIHDPETVRLVGLRTDGNSEIVHDNPVHRAVEDQRTSQVGMTDLIERTQ